MTEANDDWATGAEKVRVDHAMHEEAIAKLEKDFENQHHPYVHRISCADESLNVLSMDEADQVACLTQERLAWPSKTRSTRRQSRTLTMSLI